MRSQRNGLISAALAGAGFAVVSLTALPAIAGDSVIIRDFVLSRGIENREPVEPTSFFRADDGKAVAFARLHNSGTPTSVSFIWRHGERNHAVVPMHVGTSPGWRTWSTVNLQPGSWRVALVDSRGEVLMEQAFTVAPDSPVPIASETDSMPGLERDREGASDYPMQGAETPASVIYPMR